MTDPTLSDRYITATLSHLPQQKQPQTENDLRATITAKLMHRIGNGEDPDAAEYATLENLGNPAALAARYIHGRGALLSARIFSSWSLVTRWTCATVLPCLYLILVIVYAIGQDNIWITIFRPVGIVITVGVYLLVAVTALYALIDRQSDGSASAARWTPSQLDDQRPAQ